MKMRNGLKLALTGVAGATAICAHAAEFKSPRMRNEGFERGFTEWSVSDGGWSIASGEGRGKSSALAWEGVPGNGPSQRLAVEGGFKYRFGVYVRFLDCSAGAAKPRIVFRWFNWTDKQLGEAVATPSGDNDPNAEGWVRYEGLAAVNGGPYADISVEMPNGSDGMVLFDDFYFLVDGGETVGTLVSNAYRNKLARGTARFAVALNVNTVQNPLGGLKPVFAFEGADGKPFELAPETFAADKAIVSVDISRLKTGASRVSFSLGAAGGKTLGKAALTFFREQKPTKRRVAIDEYNRTLIDGKPFFPLGMVAGAIDKKMMDKYRQGPFNCVLPYRTTDAGLDLCRDAGIKCIPSIIELVPGVRFTRKGLEKKADAFAAIKQRVEAWKKHPALLAWYTCDEAPLGCLPIMKEVHDLVNGIDPDHPVYIALDRPEHVRQYAPAFDAIGMDPYPIGNNRGGIETAYGWAAVANEGMYGFRAMWHVPQAYNWAWHPARKKSPELFPGMRFPSREEFVSMLWQPIAAGANGLLPYSYHDMHAYAKPEELDGIWSIVCDGMAEVKRYFHILLSTPGPKVSGATPEVVVRTWNADQRVWVLACNTTREPQKAKLRLDGRYAAGACAMGGGAAVSEDGTVVGVSLPPIGVTLFSLRPL